MTIERLGEGMNRVLDCTAKASDPITAAEIAELTQMNYGTVKVYLRRLNEHGLVARVYRGQYLATDEGLAD